MTDELLKQIEDLRRKSSKYDSLMSRSREFADKLKQAAELLQEVAKELDPVSAIKTNERSNINYTEIVNELYEKMQAGVNVSTDLIINAYQIPQANASYILNKLKSMPNVDTRREGNRVYVYCRIDYKGG